MEDEKKGGNKGCVILIAIFLIVDLVFFFATHDKVEIANSGVIVTAIVFLVATYLGIKAYLQKTEGFNSKLIRIVVPIGIFIAAMAIMESIIFNFEMMVGIGFIFFVIIAVVVGIVIYCNKD